MKEFQVKNFEMSAKRPSLNSVIEQRKRLAQQQVEQDALLQQDTYTETEAKLMQEASSMSVVDHLRRYSANFSGTSRKIILYKTNRSLFHIYEDFLSSRLYCI